MQHIVSTCLLKAGRKVSGCVGEVGMETRRMRLGSIDGGPQSGSVDVVIHQRRSNIDSLEEGHLQYDTDELVTF